MFSSQFRGRAALAIIAGAALTLTACSSSGTSNTSPSSSSTADTSSTSAAGGGGTPAAGSTITIGSFASLSNPVYSTPQLKAGLTAAIGSINASGGVAGHKLALDFCDSNYDANKELSCTRSLIAQKVSAFVSPSVLADPSGKEYAAMAAAKIADVGGQGLSPAELNSPVAFPISSGIPGWVFGAAKHLIDEGVKKIAIVDDTNPGSQFFGGLVAQALKAYGVTPVSTITADPTADPTLTTAAGKVVSSGAEGIVLCPAPATVPKFVGALTQSGYKGKISSITALFAPAILKALGSAANGILLTSQVAFVTDTANAGVAKFLADMKKYQPSAVIDETTLIAWSAATLFAKVAATAKSTDAAGILAAFTGLSTPVDVGTVAPYAVAGKTSPVKGFSRIFNPTVQDGTVDNGEVKSDGKGFQPAFPST
ncbi:ABC transporter substrate-binding protein [uncultured Jatrophihabitans sp.]|uniref:ABC transporter substrate-binding protein n=1 Tax=uncultured Jatrophihabitans sp. TaxID=1610747 RepID=UPI0035CC8AC7